MQNPVYTPLWGLVKLTLIETPVCQHCGGPAQIADPFSLGDFFPCDCTMDRTPVLAPLNPGPDSWMERYFEEIY